MVTIIYLKENSKSQVITKITNIAQMGIEGDLESQQLAKYIRQGLDQLSKVGIPKNKKLVMIGKEVSGDLRTFNLLKEIISLHPLLEFRVNRRTPGAFRAIFFEYQLNKEQQLLVFTRALLKKGDPNPPELQTAISESESLYLDFISNPDKYLN